MKTNFPINGELFVWFLFTGIQLDCLFHEAPPTLCSRMGNEVQGIPSLSDSGVVLVIGGPHTALGRGNGVDVVFRKSRGGQTQHLRGHVSKLPVPRSGDQKWRLQRFLSSVFSVPCASLMKSLRNVFAVLSPTWPFSSYTRGIPSSRIKLLILMMCVTEC